VIDWNNSPYAKLKTVPVRAVTIEDGFWSQRRKTNQVRAFRACTRSCWNMAG